MTEQQLLQFLQNYAAYSGADIRAVMDERLATNTAAITTQINALVGADANFSDITEKLLRLTDAVPGSAEWNEGQNLYTAISDNFLTLDPRITTAQQAADAANAAIANLYPSLGQLEQTVSTLENRVGDFEAQTAQNFSDVDAQWKAGDQAVLGVVETNRIASVVNVNNLRNQLDIEDQLLRDGTALVATNAAANLAQAKTDLRSEIAGEKTIAHNENEALATMLTQDITAARADAASALALAKGNLEGHISEAETRANAAAATAVAGEAAARAQADTANTAAIAEVANTAAATNAILAAAMAGEASIKMELSRALRGMSSLLGYTYTPPVFTTAWTVADVAVSVPYQVTSDGDTFAPAISANLLGAGITGEPYITSITQFVPGQGDVTTQVVAGMGPLALFIAGATTTAPANVAGLLTVANNGVISYLRFAGLNVASPAPVTFVAAHQNGTSTDSSTLTITHLPN
jgi:hypothetical protein